MCGSPAPVPTKTAEYPLAKSSCKENGLLNDYVFLKLDPHAAQLVYLPLEHRAR
jgi:hypothetical protein